MGLAHGVCPAATCDPSVNKALSEGFGSRGRGKDIRSRISANSYKPKP